MVEIADIKDQDSFETWLRKTKQPQQACATLAHRAAMRAVLIAWASVLTEENLNIVPLLRSCLVTAHYLEFIHTPLFNSDGMPKYFPSDEIQGIVSKFVAEEKHDLAAAFESILFSSYVVQSAEQMYIDAAVSVEAAACAAAEFVQKSTHQTGGYAYARNHYVQVYSGMWNITRIDCQKITDSKNLSSERVFFGARRQHWHWRLQQHLASNLSPEWSFWIEWYEAAVSKKRQRPLTQNQIARQNADFWQGSDAEVNERIAALVADFEAPDDDPAPDEPDDAIEVEEGALETAESNSPNAEDIVFVEGVYDVVPKFDIAQTPLETAIRDAGFVRDDMLEASGGGNEYTILAHVAEMLTKELGRAAEDPYRLQMAVRQALGDIAYYCERGELEQEDRRVSWFRTQLRRVGDTLRDNDSEMQKAERAFNAFQPPALADDEIQPILELTEVIVGHSTERLGGDLADDSNTIADAKATPPAKKRAFYRFGSRIVRIYRASRLVFHEIAAASGVLSLIEYVMRIVRWFLANSPL